jgi:hypothetical protein
MSPGSIDTPNAKKKRAANASRSGVIRWLDPPGGRGAGDEEPGHERADRVRHAELVRDAGDEEREAHAEDHQQLVVASLDDATDPRAAVARRETEHQEESGCTQEQQRRLARGVGAAEHGRERGEVQREEQVLDHDDPEDELGLGVCRVGAAPRAAW